MEDAIDRLDRAWQLEREQYLVTGRYGSRSVPTVGSAVLVGVIAVGGGSLWTAFASSIPGAGIFPLFGVLFILAGLGMAVYVYSRAVRYRQAYQRYQQRRARLLTGQPDDPQLHRSGTKNVMLPQVPLAVGQHRSRGVSPISVSGDRRSQE